MTRAPSHREAICWVIAVAASGVIGAVWTHFLAKELRRAEDSHEALTLDLPPILGVIERVLYTASLIAGQPAFVGVWLALKMLGVGTWSRERAQDRFLYQRNLILSAVSLSAAAAGLLGYEWILAGHWWLAIAESAGLVIAAAALHLWARQVMRAVRLRDGLIRARATYQPPGC